MGWLWDLNDAVQHYGYRDVAYLLPKSNLALAIPLGGLCWIPLTLVTVLNLVFPEAVSVPLPSPPTPTSNSTQLSALAWACPDLYLRQEVDGLWEGHQAVFVQDEFLQLCAPVKTEPGTQGGESGAGKLPVMGEGRQVGPGD